MGPGEEVHMADVIEQTQDTAESSPLLQALEGIVPIVVLEASGTIQTVSPRAVEIMGIEEVDVTGRAFGQVVPGCAEVGARTFWRKLDRGPWEHNAERARFTFSVIRSETGSREGVVVVVSPIAAAQGAQDTEAADRLAAVESMLEQSQANVMMCDTHRVITYANPPTAGRSTACSRRPGKGA
jgi:nitrogen fixation/metabolism regulation signal transduction histidine kinase